MLPTCPSCKQSVLDDDAEECPFCGASMKGGGKPGKSIPPKTSLVKPSAASSDATTPSPAAPTKIPPTKIPTKATVTTATVTKATVTKATVAKSKDAEADDDDPFGVDMAAAARAILLLPRPAKGKTKRLVCPMCETPGFAGSEVAGKEVKCCNEMCQMPIFTAPRSDAANAEAQAAATARAAVPAAKKTSAPLLVTALGTVGLAAGSVWYFLFYTPAGPLPAPVLPPPQTRTNSSGQTPVIANDKVSTENGGKAKEPAKSAKQRGLELRSQILPVMVEISRQTEKNRSKSYCRRLTAEAFVEAGNLEAAQENLEQLLKFGKEVKFHQTVPLTQIGWQELLAGRQDAARKAVDQAFQAARELPEFGRLTFDTTTDLAALLFVSGRANDAQNLMQKNALPPGSAGVLAALARRVRLLRTFDLDGAAAVLPVIAWNSPQRAVTTVTLVLRGHADEGLEWARSASDPETKADCLTAWADAVVVAPQSKARESNDPIAAAVRDELPATQARVWACTAAARFTAGQKEAASTALANAVAALQSISLPADFVLPEMKEMMQLELPEALSPRLNAIAAAEVARALTLLGQAKPAAETLAVALQHLRGHAPTLLSAQKRTDAISKDGGEEVKAALKKTLDLKTDDRVRQALNQYRGKCRAALDAANARFALQTEILKQAVDWPLVIGVWTEATSRAVVSTPDEAREEFLKTDLCVRLGQRLRAVGKSDFARQCETAATTGNFSDPRDKLERETAEVVEQGDAARVAKRLAAYQPTKAEGQKVSTEDSDWSLLWSLRLACRLAKQGQIDKAFELVAAFPDMLWREDGFELLSAFAAQHGQAEPLWKKYKPTLLTPTEKIAIFRGLCAGLSAVE